MAKCAPGGDMKKRATKTKVRRKGGKKYEPSTGIADLITQKEAALIRGVTQAAIGDLIKRRRLRSVELFGKVLVYRSEVMAFKEQKTGPKTKK
jgi:hypothetical protein